jgi:multidrug efflux system outer membrane protein
MKKYINPWIFAVGFSLLLAGCKISKDLEAPEAAIPGNYNGTAASDTVSTGNLPWKSFFPEAELQVLIDSALVNNYDVQIALRNLEITQQSLRKARLNWLPDLGLNVGVSSSHPSKNSLNGSLASQFIGASHIEDYTANLAFSWEISIWGKIGNQKKLALTEYLQTTEAQKAVQTSIVSQVASGYYRLLMLDAQLEIAQKNLELNNNTLLLIRLQQEAGQVTSLAVQQAEVQQSVAAQLIPQLQQQRAIQENALRILSGEFPDWPINRSSQLAAIQLPQEMKTGVPAQMVSNRPDVKSAELQLHSANARVGIAKANMYPALNITAGFGLNSFRSFNWFNIPASLFGTVAGSLAQPVFQRRKLKTQYEIAWLERDKNVLQFQQSVLNAVGEVAGSLVKIENLHTEYEIVENRVVTLQQATGNADLLFKSGMANYLEVITTQGNVLQSELQLAALKYQQLNASIELYRALGGGWK